MLSIRALPASKLLAGFTRIALTTLTAVFLIPQLQFAAAAEPAKMVFGSKALPAKLKPEAHGFYSNGCLAGGVAMPWDGPSWQVMRPSRNRRWGHPDLIAIIEKLSIKAQDEGWNGLLVGDISQPRGGPMLTGHASHQIGLDADIWFTPMPDRRFSYSERENTSAVSVLKRGSVYVDDRRWNRTYERLLFHAAAFPQVERLLVHPGIKKKLCETVKGDRKWLSKVRPYYGHHYHFHIRIACPDGSRNCKSQRPPPNDTGCGEPLDWWFDVALKPRKPSTTGKPRKPKVVTLSDLPDACQSVVSALSKSEEKSVFAARSLSGFRAPELDLPKQFDPLAALASKPIEQSSEPVSASRFTDLSGLGGRLPSPTRRPSK